MIFSNVLAGFNKASMVFPRVLRRTGLTRNPRIQASSMVSLPGIADGEAEVIAWSKMYCRLEDIIFNKDLFQIHRKGSRSAAHGLCRIGAQIYNNPVQLAGVAQNASTGLG